MRHAGGQFKHSSIVNSVARILAPGKRPVIGDKHHRHILRVDVAFAKTLDNRKPGFGFVLPLDAGLAEQARARNLAVEVIDIVFLPVDVKIGELAVFQKPHLVLLPVGGEEVDRLVDIDAFAF